jgi:hypothetical protein
MTTEIKPEELYFGTPVSLTVGGTEVGATTEPPTLEIEIEEYTPEFQGAKGPVMGTKIIRRAIPRVNLTVNQLTAEKLAWAMPGAASTTTSIAPVGGGGTGALASPAAAGDLTITLGVGEGADFSAGDFVRVGAAGPTADYREIAVGGITGDVLTFTRALSFAHAAATTVTQVEGDGRTTITWTAGRLPSSAYKDVVMRGEGLDGREIQVTVENAASAENQELSFADDDITGLSLALTGHYGPTTPTKVPLEIVLL